MADANQFPQNAIQRRVNPTLTGTIVSKFDVTPSGYRDKDEIENEIGALSNILYVDQSISGEVELVLAANTAIPTEGSTLAFTTTAATPNFAAWSNGGTMTMLINSPVKPGGNNGKGLRVSFTVFKNSILPTAGPG